MNHYCHRLTDAQLQNYYAAEHDRLARYRSCVDLPRSNKRRQTFDQATADVAECRIEAARRGIVLD